MARTTPIFFFLLFLNVCHIARPEVTSSDNDVTADDKGTVMHEWVAVDFDWPSEAWKAKYIANGMYVPEYNYLSGVKIYKKEVYVTVPRLRYTHGVPSTLNKVVKVNGTDVLRPFPDWPSQKQGDCSALQCAMSMEVDPINGHMYVIDAGRAGIFAPPGEQSDASSHVTFCPAKLVVYDLNDGSLVRSHEFPESVVAKETNFLNDIVLDRGIPLSTSVRYVYITDATDSKLYSFDLNTNITTTFYHKSFEADPGVGSDITVSGVTYKMVTPIDGLAISGDFRYVYYCALGSKDLYQVDARALRTNSGVDFASSVRFVGAKVSQTGGMTYGERSLFFGALTEDAVYKWDVKQAEQDQNVQTAQVKMLVQEKIVQDHQRLLWPDSFTIDEDGYLWFSACKAHLFLRGGMDWSGTSGANYRIWRIKANEKSYLAHKEITQTIFG